jgi:hypothetical protein
MDDLGEKDVPNWHHCRDPGVSRHRFRGLLGHPLVPPCTQSATLTALEIERTTLPIIASSRADGAMY